MKLHCPSVPSDFTPKGRNRIEGFGRFTKKLLLFILIFAPLNLSACVWCVNPDMKLRLEQALVDEYQPVKEAELFYKHAVVTHYPKAYIIREQYFPTMCPVAIEAALKQIINVFTEKTWFYFTNKQKDFRWGAYWERIVTICRILSNFMLRAQVRLEDNSVFEKKSIFETLRVDYEEDETQSISLVDYFKQNGLTGYYDFYAFYFDYLLKIFNEGIKFKNERKATEYFFDLEVVVEKLQESKYQANYETAFARSKRLRERLKAEKKKDEKKKVKLYDDDDLDDLPPLVDAGDK